MENVKDKLRFSNKKKLPVILQSEAAECGLASICMIANYYGHKVDLFSVRRKYPISLKGATLKQLVNISSQLHMTGRPIKVELENLNKLKAPIILHWDLNHFVVLKEVKRTGIVIHDPAKGEVFLTMEAVSKSFTGIALEVRPTEGFKQKNEELKLGFGVLWRSVTGLKRSLLQVIILSFVLQLLALLAPYFIQLVVDNVVITNDRSFLLVLGIGFSLLLLLKVATEAFRSWIIVYLRTTLGIQLVSNLFRHMLRLPMDWFGKRFIGDVISRFNSLDYIKQLLSGGFVEGLIDGVMAVITLIMMFVFAPLLAVITVVAISCYTLARVLSFGPIRSHTKEKLQLRAVADGLFYESVRSVQPVKVFSGEAIRQSKLENANADWMNADIKLGKLTIGYTTIKELMLGMEYVLLIWLGAYLVLDEEMTVGILFAFLAYRQQFTTSAQTLLEKVFEWRMMGLHLTRIADIALEDEEKGLETDYPQLEQVQGKIELKNISYRYNENEPYIFENLSLTIEAGESVALIAPSGFGKTTLMKIIMGLLMPTSGSVLLDGKDIYKIGLTNYRHITSAVMQGDDLLSGSIGDNISFFAIEQDMERLEKAAKDAVIFDDINAMPMGFHSLAGDMGSTLSGGQVQRVLIARALYKDPKILFLDEASSALDVETEKKINEVVKNMGITRIVIAHREATINMADRIIDLTNLKDAAPVESTPEKPQQDKKQATLKVVK
ncbi:peptidase domain-containing ABC transporter [Thalassomonas haliotis]|uniref:Peptidase domain-containing ABC transporter n=1 Tax=Thalassomonas haliotis TaxID=485448 RepID=A0ABY7VKT5_9GAMM|nr:peptidase domain-containing ABC transporter [Thalassomonas haliotis]WDE14345.1 peptidase domain-containing ABC transporter [Thalassomonas haliotis]